MSSAKNATLVLAAGAIVLALTLGTRHAFGLFLQPVSDANGWGREVFAFTIALQNLMWGVAQPFAGLLADRRGAGPVLIAGSVLYTAGIAGMALAGSATVFILVAGVLAGLGLAGVTMPVVFGAISRALPAEKRSMAFGVAMSVGSFGQFLFLPAALSLIDGFGWAATLLIFSALSALIIPLSFALWERPAKPDATAPTAGAAAQAALRDRGFLLLGLGFFVCGFQVVFIGVHLPAFLLDEGLSIGLGTTVLALIGLFNIFGSLGAGWLGSRFGKPQLLAGIYLARGVAIAAFVLLPITEASAYLFAVLMGFLWLSTVPLTNGAVATMFGTRDMAFLGGIVFLAHQVGSFLGGWLGGLVYDRAGSYDIAWGIAIALSLMAALVNWPVREAPVTKEVVA